MDEPVTLVTGNQLDRGRIIMLTDTRMIYLGGMIMSDIDDIIIEMEKEQGKERIHGMTKADRNW